MKKVLSQAQNQLEKALLDIKRFPMFRSKSLPLNSSDLCEKYLHENILSKINDDKQVIYIIKTKSGANLTEVLSKYKSSNSRLKLPQINKRNFNSEVLYVGSVQKNFRDRVKQHLGFGSISTYSLKLSKWTKKEKLDFVIKYYVLGTTNSEITLKLIENNLANILKPQFGKYDKLKKI